MFKNRFGRDRVIRLILGLTIATIGFYHGSFLGMMGVGPTFTGLFGFFPVVYLLDKLGFKAESKD